MNDDRYTFEQHFIAYFLDMLGAAMFVLGIALAWLCMSGILLALLVCAPTSKAAEFWRLQDSADDTDLGVWDRQDWWY